MAGTRKRLMLDRRQAAFGLASLPLAFQLTGCADRRRTTTSQSGDRADGPVKPLTSAEKADLVELYDGGGIRLDLRYATANNFTGEILYSQPRAFLVGAAVTALGGAIKAAQQDGFGLTVFDAYRPWRVTKRLWDATPPAKRGFVADPKEGSRHNRGCAIDCTLYDLKTGEQLPMPSGYDEFTSRAYRNYVGGGAAETANRERLERYMANADFVGISNEWWHFDFSDWINYPVLDVAFETL